MIHYTLVLWKLCMQAIHGTIMLLDVGNKEIIVISGGIYIRRIGGLYQFVQTRIQHIVDERGCIILYQIAPVSYTHLDVYKRQTISSAGTSIISAAFLFHIR